MLVDSHAHLDDGRFAADLGAVLDRAREAGVERIVTVGTGLASCEAAIALAQRNPGFVCASVGIHPHDAAGADEAALARLTELARSPGVAAIGETGLDYHYDRSPRDVQRAVFASQIRMALELNLPVVVHCREAYDGLPGGSERARREAGCAGCCTASRGTGRRRMRWSGWAFSSRSRDR